MTAIFRALWFVDCTDIYHKRYKRHKLVFDEITKVKLSNGMLSTVSPKKKSYIKLYNIVYARIVCMTWAITRSRDIFFH